MIRLVYILCSCLLVLFAAAAPAITLSVGDFTTVPADQITLPIDITVTDDEDVSGVQFDLLFDTAALTGGNVVIGPASEAALKTATVTAQPDGSIRVLLIGFNQNLFASGTIALADLGVNSNAPGGTYLVTLANVQLSDPFGFALTAQVTPGTVTVTVNAGEG